MNPFPPDFLWGAATSSYQIEGSPLADGAGPSDWHLFSHTPGRTAHGHTGDAACDHYRRWAQDIALMGELGLRAYRFSLAWARILPDGTGSVNQAGLDFYDRLIEGLLKAGITPVPTLFHWDLPAALAQRGGWTHRDSADWFAEYAQVVFRRLGDRVSRWTTLNEPWVVVDGGYVSGMHPPGQRDLGAAARATHNLLRAHGQAVRCFRAEGQGEIGLVVNLEPKDAASSTAEDLAAAHRAEAYMNRQFLDPVILGAYPAEMAEMYGDQWPEFPEKDFALIGEPTDFLGVNYYSRSVNRNAPEVVPTGAAPVKQEGSEYTAFDWEVHPASLVKVLNWVRNRYGDRPIYITENGAAFDDPLPDQNGRVADVRRLAYLKEHLRAVGQARENGVDVRGYFAWSLLDNFEWAFGYDKRFGLVQVDFATQKRTIKDSGYFYRDVVASGGQILFDQGRAQRTVTGM
nr:GH1 family beta-glucosidase [Candidatus Krumholzibacteria bacterium]